MKFETFITKNAKNIIFATITLVILSCVPLFFIKINPDLESYIPEDIDARVNMDRIASVFGEEDNILLLIESEDILEPSILKQISGLGESLSQISGVTKIYSLYHAKHISGENGMLVSEPVIPIDPEEGFDRESLRRSIIKNDMVYKLIISKDFTASLIILSTDKSVNDHELMQSVKEVISEHPGKGKVSITGMPYLRDEANRKITADLLLLLPLGIMVMFIFLWSAFRSLRGVLLPMSVVLISILFSLALIPVLGWQLGLIGVLIPVMMIAIANNYGVHVYSRYQEEISRNTSRSIPEVIESLIQYLKKPVLLTGLTTIAGVLGLVTHILLPAAQMGIIASLSIGLALLLSISFIPAVMSRLSILKRPALARQRKGYLSGILSGSGNLVVDHKKWIIVIFIIFLLISVFGLKWFSVAPDSSGVLPSSHPFNVAADKTDQKFGGSKMLQIMFKGDVRDPALIKKMDTLSTQISQVEGVGSVNSIVPIIKKISAALNDPGTQYYNKIPDNYETIAQYLEMFNMSGDPAALEQFADFNFEYTQMTIQYRADDIRSLNRIVDSIRELVRDDETCIALGGYSLVDKALSESVFHGQNYSLIFAFIVIALLLSWIFKSAFAGLLGSLPLFFAVLVTFGIMGWLGIELNIVTALLSSISIGLGVDFTIHLFWRLKYEIRSGADLQDAVKTSLITIGRGITINAFTVIAGFSVLFFSAFPLIHSFAFLIIISIVMCLLCALFLMPALCMIIKPGFLFK